MLEQELRQLNIDHFSLTTHEHYDFGAPPPKEIELAPWQGTRYITNTLKFYIPHAQQFGIQKACLIYQLMNSFNHKKFFKDSALYYLDYSYKKMVKLMGYTVKDRVCGDMIKYICKSSDIFTRDRAIVGSERGRRLFRGRGYQHNMKNVSTGIVSVQAVKEVGFEAAYIEMCVNLCDTNYAKNIKTGNVNAKVNYAIASSNHLDNMLDGVLTPTQKIRNRAKLISLGRLYKIRSKNLVNKKQTTNQWVYSTNMKSIETYRSSKRKNYVFTDKELSVTNELGITLNNSFDSFRSQTHISLFVPLRHCLTGLKKISSFFNDIDDVDNNEMMSDYASYCTLENQKQQERKEMAFRNYQAGHIQADLTKMPSTDEIIAIVQSKGGQREHAFYIEKIIHAKYFKNGKLTLKNYVAFIISMVHKVKQNDGLPEPNATKHVGEPAPSFLSNNTTSHGDDTPTYLIPKQGKVVDDDPMFLQEPQQVEQWVSKDTRQENIRLMKEFMEKSNERKRKEELSFGGMKPQSMD